MMKQKLSLPQNPFVDNFLISPILYRDRQNRYCSIDSKYINKKTSSIFDNLGLEVGGIIIFKKHQHGISPIHRDILLEDNKWTVWRSAINYNLTEAKSKMMWFETSLEEVYPKRTYRLADYDLSGIHYDKWSNSCFNDPNFNLIDEEDIQNPTLVRTDVPHTTINLDAKDRLCASIRFKINYTFDELLSKFKEFLL